MDAGALADVLARLEARAGTQVAAAHELGVSPLYFWRLRHRRGGKAIGLELYRRLRLRALRDGLSPQDIARAVTAPEAVARLGSEYMPWLRAQFEALDCDLVGPSAHSASVADRGPASRLFDQLRTTHPSYFRGFERRARRRGHSSARVYLAELRAVWPLLDGARSGGIERDLGDFSDRALREYLKVALRREEILLERSPDRHRAHTSPQPSRIPHYPLLIVQLR